jgi:hypothetical protein
MGGNFKDAMKNAIPESELKGLGIDTAASK